MAAVSLSKVQKTFGKRQVLFDIDLEIEEGEMVALIGASGSGKSTLIRLICGLERMDPRSGSKISLFDKVTQNAGRQTQDLKTLRQEVGVIFQQFNLVGRISLLTNVLCGRLGRIPNWRGTLGLFPKRDQALALRSLERVGMIAYAHQRASTLSGGQQQRGAIARVLTQEAKLILADEPIASLDPASAKHVMEALRKINTQDKTTVIVSLHQIDHAFEHCDKIIALKDGRVIHHGNTGDMTQEDIAALYGLEAGELDLKPRKTAEGSSTDQGMGAGSGYGARNNVAASASTNI